jgi:hypothetical protein
MSIYEAVARSAVAPFRPVWDWVKAHEWEIGAMIVALLNLTQLALADPRNAVFPAYFPHGAMAPLWLWAVFFAVASVMLFVGTPSHMMRLVRVGLFLSAVLWGFFGWGFVLAENTPWAGVMNRWAVSMTAGILYLLASRDGGTHDGTGRYLGG